MAKLYDCIVVGGGYSGLVLAITLAQNNKRVLIIEQNELLGRKILSTGNGRCNFTNQDMSLDYFYSNSSLDDFSFDYKKSIEFLQSIGIIEKNNAGYFYPITNQAKTVRDAFDIKVKELGIKTRLSTKVTSIEKDEHYTVLTNNGLYSSKNVVIATGGLAASSLGSTGEGYDFAKAFGIKVTKLAPSLVGLKSSDSKLKTISGVRTQGIVSLNGHSCEGEIQFNKDSISGYPVMCISRFYSLETASSPKELTVNFIPYMNTYELSKELTTRFNNCYNKTASELLVGLVNDKCIDLILKDCHINADSDAAMLKEKDIKNILTKLTNMHFSIAGTKGFELAQVTAGGVSLDELDTNTLMCKRIDLEGLYFVGEICDVDGICGGYNLEWARHSAYLAATDIINRLGKEK